MKMKYQNGNQPSPKARRGDILPSSLPSVLTFGSGESWGGVGIDMDWVLRMLPLSYAASKLAAVVVPFPYCHPTSHTQPHLELTALCTTLLDRVLALETNLRQTKKVYGTAYIKLIMLVKKLEKTVKSNQARGRTKVVVSDDEEDSEDSSKQGRMIEDIDQDTRITLVTPTKMQLRKRLILILEEGDHTPDVVQEGVKGKGKAIMQDSEQPKKIKKRVQIQTSLDEELAQKLYEEEQSRFNAEQETKFNAEQEELLASETTKDKANPSVNNVNWDDVQA
nr:hypothetical protein [Tanacetum cinerariifolium]